MKKILVCLLSVLIIASCTNAEAGTPKRFQVVETDSDTYYAVIRDTKTGCEYIRAGVDSTFVYLHGSCPEIIKSEQK